jgi:predicted peptidase
MNSRSSYFVAFLMFVMIMSFSVLCVSTDRAGRRGSYGAHQHVKSVTAIAEVFGEGQKITAAAVEYDANIISSKLLTSTFSVNGRTITKVYANNAAAKAAKGMNGRYAIVELSPSDKGAATYEPNPVGANPGRGRDAPTDGARGGTSADAARGPRASMPPIERKPIRVSLTQLGDIATTDGKTYAPDADAMENDKQKTLIVDDFLKLEFKDSKTATTLKYNLFVPKKYNRKQSYPMVMFIHDAGVIGDESDIALIQGLGAVIWATPSEQAKHDCFVLAPQFSTVSTDDPERHETIVHLIDSIVNQYNIDKNRLYATGQSMGCMLSIAISIKYPDLFAASLLVAGQWDAQAMSVLADKKMWIIVSEGDTRAFPGMNASLAVMEAAGTKISRAKWNARAGEAETAANVRKMIEEGNNIKYAVFEKGTSWPVDQEQLQSGRNEHMQTWKIAYAIEGVRDWLFAQKKAPKP